MGVNCTFEATPVWGALLEREFALKPIELSGKGHVITLWRHRLYRRVVSTPFRDRMAVRWDGERPTSSDLAHTLSKSAEAEIVAKDIGWFADAADTSSAQDACRIERFTNADVALDAALESRIRRTTQQVLRKSQRGVEPQVRLDDGSGLGDFYALYLQTRRRLGVLPYSRSFFRYWFDRIGAHAVVFKATDGATPVGFMLCYLHGDEMMPSLLAYDYVARPYKLVVLSDHGQTQGATFKQRNGYDLGQLVERSIERGTIAHIAQGDENDAAVGHAVSEATSCACPAIRLTRHS